MGPATVWAVVLVQAVVPTAVRVAARALARVAAQVRAEDPVAALPVEVLAQVEPRAADLAVARPADPVPAQAAVQARAVDPVVVQSDLVVVLRVVLVQVAGPGVGLVVVRAVAPAAVQSVDLVAALRVVVVQVGPREADLVVVRAAGRVLAWVAVRGRAADPVVQSLESVRALAPLKKTPVMALARLPMVDQWPARPILLAPAQKVVRLVARRQAQPKLPIPRVQVLPVIQLLQ